MQRLACAVVAGTVGGLAAPAVAQNWHNSGGNAGRNGLTSEVGPTAPDELWSGGRSSLIAWQPVIEDDRVFLVRQPGWPDSAPGDSFVVCMDLDTGVELWAEEIPYDAGDWITWIAGVRDGRVFASRSGNGASVSARLHCLDAADGHTLWISDDEIDAGAYDGVVFAPDGDPVIASFRDIWRIDAADGHTVWHATRLASVSGNCGGALYGDAFYVVDVTGGGHIIVRYDLATGARMYESEVMPGFTIQNTPMVGEDGTIYLSRTQNNAAVDYFYALDDDGAAITIRWSVPAAWSTSSEFAVDAVGAVFMLMPGPELIKLDPTDGSILATAGIIPDFDKPRMAADGDGKLYMSNGGFAAGRLYCFDSTLTELWSVPVRNINIGGPAVGRDGTVVVCGNGTIVRAYRAACAVDLNGDGLVNSQDFILFLNLFTAGDPAADFNGDGTINSQDFIAFLNAFVAGC